MWTGGDVEQKQKQAIRREHAEAVQDGNHALAARIRAANPDLFESEDEPIDVDPLGPRISRPYPRHHLNN